MLTAEEIANAVWNLERPSGKNSGDPKNPNPPMRMDLQVRWALHYSQLGTARLGDVVASPTEASWAKENPTIYPQSALGMMMDRLYNLPAREAARDRQIEGIAGTQAAILTALAGIAGGSFPTKEEILASAHEGGRAGAHEGVLDIIDDVETVAEVDPRVIEIIPLEIEAGTDK